MTATPRNVRGGEIVTLTWGVTEGSAEPLDWIGLYRSAALFGTLAGSGRGAAMIPLKSLTRPGAQHGGGVCVRPRTLTRAGVQEGGLGEQAAADGVRQGEPKGRQVVRGRAARAGLLRLPLRQVAPPARLPPRACARAQLSERGARRGAQVAVPVRRALGRVHGPAGHVLGSARSLSGAAAP